MPAAARAVVTGPAPADYDDDDDEDEDEDEDENVVVRPSKHTR